jgi:hypothetical protein
MAFQADVQDYVDMSISSTINLPAWGSRLNNEDTVRHWPNMPQGCEALLVTLMVAVEDSPSPLCLTARLSKSLGKSLMNTLRPMTSVTSVELVDHAGFKNKKAGE